MPEPLLRPKAVAALLAVGLATVYRLAAAGVLPCVKIPGTTTIRFRREQLEALLAQWESGGRRRGGAR